MHRIATNIASIIAAPKRIQKPMYSTAAAGSRRGSGAAGKGCLTVVTKAAPQLAQKSASWGLSCAQILHSTDLLHSWYQWYRLILLIICERSFYILQPECSPLVFDCQYLWNARMTSYCIVVTISQDVTLSNSVTHLGNIGQKRDTKCQNVTLYRYLRAWISRGICS